MKWRRLGLLVTTSCLLSVALRAQQPPENNPPPAGAPVIQQGSGGERRVIQQGPGGPGGGQTIIRGGPGGPGQRIIIGGPGGPPEVYPEAKAMPQPKNDAELAAAIKTLADKLAEDGRFSGSIIWAKDGEPLVNGAWGFADQNRGTTNTVDTAFDTGSITKLFTQSAILQLMEQGKLSLDDSAGKYLKDYPNRAVIDKVTIRQLLLHTSGMGDIFGQFLGSIPDFANMTELSKLLPLFVDKPLEFEPGAGNRYSNAGYIVLGLVIEAVSGENYFDYVQHRVLDAAGMTHSGFFNRAKLPPTVARSYENGQDFTSQHPGRGSPAGGLQASAGDLLKFTQAINSGKLLKAESVTLLNTLVPRPPGAPTGGPGKLVAYGIEGGAPGVSAQLVLDPTGHYTRIVLCNGGPPMAMQMAFTIREWFRQMPK